ncbi:MAG: hypothetical protein ACXWNC_00035 [Anaerolineales bacterium]
MDNQQGKEDRLAIWIAILTAVVSLTTALTAWRVNALGSKAGDLIYQGMLDAVKKQAAANEDWRQTYQEAGYARDYLVTLNGLQVRENSTDPAAQEQAAQLRTYLLPGMKSLATPLGTDPTYFTPGGLLNVQKRFNDLETQSSDLSNLNPQASFSQADNYYAEQRWLVVGTIMIAVSLFWLGLSQLSHLRPRVLILVLGVAVYGIGLVWSLGVEVIFFFLRGGVL